MATGDHIYVNRFGGVYNHHGIDCGDGTVIHYTSPSWRHARSIERTPIERFARGDEVQVRDYSEFEETVSQANAVDKMIDRASKRLSMAMDQLHGIALEELDFSPAAVVGRAESRLGESRFDLVFNNCEHFSAWCKTGLSSSSQIDAVWRASMGYQRFVARQTRMLLTRLLD